MRNLQIAPIGLGDMLLSSAFTVPTYQRSYAWEEVQVTNLLTDITGAMKRTKAGRGDAYFLGSIVVIKRKGAKSLEVVDGQQRLATVSIILAAIRDFHLELNKTKAADSYDQYLRSHHVPTGKHPPKLRLNDIDDRCYERAILQIPAKRTEEKWTVKSHKRIVTAYESAVRHIKSIAQTHSTKNAIDELYQMVEFIRANVQVIRVLVEDDADAFTIFETLNDRHMLLTVSDLLKNFLFGTSGQYIEEAKGNWRQMQTDLQNLKGRKDRTVDFLRQLWGSMHGLVRERELFRDIKSKITDEEEARELSASLADQAADYVAVLNPDSEFWSDYGTDAKLALATFNKLRVERIRPLLLAILHRFSEKEVSKALSYLRSAVVRIVVTSGINGTIEEAIFEIAVKIHHREIKRASQLAEAMRQLVPNDSVFKATFETMHVSKGTLSRFYLQEIEDFAKGLSGDERVVNRNEKQVNLEHIIPLSPNERAEHWPELSPELGFALCKRLGNQTLLSKSLNSGLNGKSYAEKSMVYKQCQGIGITKSIPRDFKTAFGLKEVNQRQGKLAEWALKVWPIP